MENTVVPLGAFCNEMIDASSPFNQVHIIDASHMWEEMKSILLKPSSKYYIITDSGVYS